MFRFKLGLHLYMKRIGLNFLILLNLLIIVFAANSLVLFHNANVKIGKMTKGLEQEKIALMYGDVELEEISKIPGFVKKYNFIYNTVYDNNSTNEIKFDALMYNADFLAKLDYKPKKGRWFQSEDENSKNVVLSYNTKYKVGDTIDMVYNKKIISVNVIGILAPNEFQFSQYKFLGGTWEGNFTRLGITDHMIIYCDFNYIQAQAGETVTGLSIRFYQFDNSMPKDEFDDVIKKLNVKHKSQFVSTAEMKILTQEYQQRANKLFIPVVIIISLLGLAGFIIMSYINIKGCKREYLVMQSLGAKSRDLIAILSVMMIIPFVFVAILISSFSSFSLLPISFYPNITTPLNFIIAFSIIIFYVGINMAFLSLMLLRNKGFKEVVNEVE